MAVAVAVGMALALAAVVKVVVVRAVAGEELKPWGKIQEELRGAKLPEEQQSCRFVSNHTGSRKGGF